MNDDDDEAQQSINDFSDLSRRSLMKDKIIFWNNTQTSNNSQIKLDLTHSSLWHFMDTIILRK